MPLPSDIQKTRDVVFAGLPPGQAKRAFEILRGFAGLDVQLMAERHIRVAYNVQDYTLEVIEESLVVAGFHLDDAIMQKLKRALARYCESVQRQNLQAPETDKRVKQAYASAWQHHAHGDRDETPKEWREYK